MNRKAKNILLGVILSAGLFIGVNNVNAVTIKETTDTEDSELSKIADNTIIIGSTKFESGYVLSALRIAKAVTNDIELNKENPNYEGVKIYNYFMGDWYQYKEDNSTSYIDPEIEENEELLEELNNQAIYFVNNEEKVLDVKFNNNIVADENYEIRFNADNGDKKITLEGDTLKIPATVKSFDISVVKVNEDTGNVESETIVSSFVKENEDLSASTFEYAIDEDSDKPITYVGTFERTPDKTGGENLTTTFDGSTVTFDGNIAYYRNDSSVGRIAGNRVGVQINAPEGMTDLSGVKVTIGETTYNFDDIKDGDGFFWWYPLVEAGTNRTYTAKVAWAEGFTQTFTIKVTDESTLVSAPAGTIEGVKQSTDEEYTVEGNKITVSGQLTWFKADANAQNGRIAGNYAGVKITAPDGLTLEFLKENATVKIDDRTSVEWGEVIDSELNETTFFVYYPRFDDTDTHTVKITWEAGNTQEFTINSTAKKTDPYKGTIEGNTSFDSNLEYTSADENTITVKGIISWTNSDNIATEIAGNYAAVKFNAPIGYEPADYADATISIDGVEAGSWKSDYVYYPIFKSLTDEHTVVITWQNGNAQTFTVKLDSTAKLLAAPKGTVEGVDKDLTFDINKDNKIVSIGGTLKYTLASEVQAAGNYATVKFTAPTQYKNTLSNVKVLIDGIDEIVNAFSSNSTSYEYTAKFESLDSEHNVSITWDNGNTEVYTIKLAEDAKLDKSVTVANETEFRAALNDINVTTINVTNNFDIEKNYIQIDVNRDLTIDFGGNTITAKGENTLMVSKYSNGSTLTFKNGKFLASENEEYDALQVGEVNHDDLTKEVSLNGTRVVLAKDFTLESNYRGLVLLGSNFSVDVYGSIKTNSFAISGNYDGHYLQKDITVNIYGGAIVSSENDTAIYMPSYIKLNILGGEVTGITAINIKLGEINISDGTLTATGKKVLDSELVPTTGSVESGDVIYADINGTYYTHYQTNNNITEQAININITGGTLTSTNANIIREYNGVEGVTLKYNTNLAKDFTEVAKVVTYNAKDAVVEVDGYNYSNDSLKAAIENGSNIKLLGNVTVNERIYVKNSEVTIDLNGKTMSFTGTNRIQATESSKLTIKNGTLKGQEYALAAFDNSTLTVDEDVVIDMTDKTVTANKYGIFLRDNATVNFNGEIKIEGTTAKEYYGISGNGSIKGNTTLNVTGKITSSGAAIYQPQTGTTTINEGSELTANTVIAMKAAKLIVNGGTLTATGANNAPVASGDGFNLTGDVIYLEEKIPYDGEIKVTINGGTLNSENANIIREINTTNNIVIVEGLYSNKETVADTTNVFVYTATEEQTTGEDTNEVTNTDSTPDDSQATE